MPISTSTESTWRRRCRQPASPPNTSSTDTLHRPVKSPPRGSRRAFLFRWIHARRLPLDAARHVAGAVVGDHARIALLGVLLLHAGGYRGCDRPVVAGSGTTCRENHCKGGQ